MSFIGHVYPAIFFLGCGGLLLLQSRVALHRHSASASAGADACAAATNGGSRFQLRFGLVVMAVTMTGIVVEGVGGALTQSSMFFQVSCDPAAAPRARLG